MAQLKTVYLTELLKQRLLIEIARLEDDFENSKISEEVYGNLRAEKKAK
jgi:hypothetical protein